MGRYAVVLSISTYQFLPRADWDFLQHTRTSQRLTVPSFFSISLALCDTQTTSSVIWAPQKMLDFLSASCGSLFGVHAVILTCQGSCKHIHHVTRDERTNDVRKQCCRRKKVKRGEVNTKVISASLEWTPGAARLLVSKTFQSHSATSCYTQAYTRTDHRHAHTETLTHITSSRTQ